MEALRALEIRVTPEWALAPAPQVKCGRGGLEARGLRGVVEERLNFFLDLPHFNDDFDLDDERPRE